jgi:hypothetical protein
LRALARSSARLAPRHDRDSLRIPEVDWNRTTTWQNPCHSRFGHSSQGSIYSWRTGRDANSGFGVQGSANGDGRGWVGNWGDSRRGVLAFCSTFAKRDSLLQNSAILSRQDLPQPWKTRWNCQSRAPKLLEFAPPLENSNTQLKSLAFCAPCL